MPACICFLTQQFHQEQQTTLWSGECHQPKPDGNPKVQVPMCNIASHFIQYRLPDQAMNQLIHILQQTCQLHFGFQKMCCHTMEA